MSAIACPQGHTSSDPEWCDVCGERLGAPPVPTAPPSGAPAGASVPAGGSSSVSSHTGGTLSCPHCDDLNPPDTLFCENCGYDFVTGQAPPPLDPSPAVAPALPAPSPSPDGTGAAGVGAVPGAKSVGPPPVPSGWIAVVEVDPQWFAIKGELSDTPCPPVSSATVALTGTTMLIGRSSQSRNIHPEIALDTDTAVSRRHARLDLVVGADGAKTWTVSDLGSTNGTHHVLAGAMADAETTALAPEVATPVADGDRVYVGAWTAITVRKSS